MPWPGRWARRTSCWWSGWSLPGHGDRGGSDTPDFPTHPSPGPQLHDSQSSARAYGTRCAVPGARTRADAPACPDVHARRVRHCAQGAGGAGADADPPSQLRPGPGRLLTFGRAGMEDGEGSIRMVLAPYRFADPRTRLRSSRSTPRGLNQHRVSGESLRCAAVGASHAVTTPWNARPVPAGPACAYCPPLLPSQPGSRLRHADKELRRVP